LKINKNRILTTVTFRIVGSIKDHIENPDALKTLNSLFLFNLIYVFIELNKKTVGSIIGNSVGI
jgi:hypothetical protein